ncbi:MAG: hypothetical protein IH626_07170 [Rhodospirillales bacterium]|nr:hypothetical protein [Rhodospirillales bacterium]
MNDPSPGVIDVGEARRGQKKEKSSGTNSSGFSRQAGRATIVFGGWRSGRCGSFRRAAG